MANSKPKVEAFNEDVLENAGYLYSTGAPLSSQLATQRHYDLIMGSRRFTGRSILDIGCGDGFFTRRYWDNAHPASITGLDAAEMAVRSAQHNAEERPLTFVAGDAHRLPYRDDSFDVALIQAILHHDDDVPGMLREAFRVAPEILILEPNGYNVGLKVLEKVSPYHVKHHERSYTERRMRQWVREAGGRVVARKFAGLVPMFSPDWLARGLKKVEPLVERAPVLRQLTCAVYVQIAVRRQSLAV